MVPAYATVLLSFFNVNGIIVASAAFAPETNCGPKKPMPDGSPGQCDPESDEFCCSAWGFCGGTAEHCDCEGCMNYNQNKTRKCLYFKMK